jgi:hypothetical protein
VCPPAPGVRAAAWPDQHHLPGQLHRHRIGDRPGIGQQPRRRPGRVFLLDELPGLVEQFGIPEPRWNGQYQTWTTWPAEAYIEVQLWTDEPNKAYLLR